MKTFVSLLAILSSAGAFAQVHPGAYSVQVSGDVAVDVFHGQPESAQRSTSLPLENVPEPFLGILNSSIPQQVQVESADSSQIQMATDRGERMTFFSRGDGTFVYLREIPMPQESTSVIPCGLHLTQTVSLTPGKANTFQATAEFSLSRVRSMDRPVQFPGSTTSVDCNQFLNDMGSLARGGEVTQEIRSRYNEDTLLMVQFLIESAVDPLVRARIVLPNQLDAQLNGLKVSVPLSANL
jgi:hypothetical protein